MKLNKLSYVMNRMNLLVTLTYKEPRLKMSACHITLQRKACSKILSNISCVSVNLIKQTRQSHKLDTSLTFHNMALLSNPKQAILSIIFITETGIQFSHKFVICRKQCIIADNERNRTKAPKITANINLLSVLVILLYCYIVLD